MKTVTLFIILAALAGGVLLFLPPATGAARRGNPATGKPGKNTVTVRFYDQQGQLSGGYTMNKIIKTDEEWRKQLTPEQYTITRAKGTEQAFCGNLLDTKEEGIYACVCCGLPLFASETKFHSGTGWPSFFAPVAKENITTHTDRSFGMARTEILCARCDAHLGHVFEDGPKPTGLRYCLNSAALTFTPKTEYVKEHGLQTATFAMGCFWHVEDLFRQVPGVVDAVSGYTGGHFKNPTYQDVCTGKTGHAESVQVTFDPALVTYPALLKAFWENHDPTTPNRQGPDVGSQYRSVIFCHTPEQKAAAEAAKAALEKAGAYERPIVTEIVPAGTFYKAEEYHQRYLEKHGRSACNLM